MAGPHKHNKECKCEQSKPSPWQSEKKYRLADFFDSHWDEYCKHPTEFIEPEQYKAVNAIRTCQTAVLGIDVYACPECGEIVEKYHTCKNRFCPSCSWRDTLKWAERQFNKMMNIKHRHAIFTLPHDLHPLVKANKKVIYNALMRTAADTFKDWQKHKFGLSCGIISVLHTFGEKKEMHNHAHMIVSWGGIDVNTGELREIRQEFVKFDFLKDKFRCKFEDELIRLFDEGDLKHKFSGRMEFMQFIKHINRQSWIIHIEPPMNSPEEVIKYIGRYSKRACLSEYKITNIDGEYITFKYKDNKDRDKNKKAKEKELCLHYTKFFPRLLQHVPLPYFRIVRYYGKYHPKSKIPQEYLYNGGENNEQNSELLWSERQLEETGTNPLFCTTCNCEREYCYTVFDLRTRKERTKKFDVNKHKHLIINREHLKNAA